MNSIQRSSLRGTVINILTIILVILTITLSINLYKQTSKLNDTQAALSETKQQISDLETLNSDLNLKIIELEQSNKKLKQDKEQLEKYKAEEEKKAQKKVSAKKDTSAKKEATTSSNPTSTSNKALGNFKITAYCNCSKCCGKWAGGPTASGTTPTAGRTIAVDPRVIPLGSKVKIGGRTYVAEDTGGAIKGNRIDMYFGSHSEALRWGVQYKNVSLV